MQPVYGPQRGHDWLRQMISWSKKQEKVIDKLQHEAPVSSELKEQLAQWRHRFTQFREMAENRFPPTVGGFFPQHGAHTTSYLLQQSHQLHYSFSRFLQNQLLRASTQAHVQAISNNDESDSAIEEDAQIEGERGAGKGIHTVLIGEHTLPELPYPYNALEPYIDEKTMRLHHNEHHRSYVDGLNKAEKEMEKARKSGDFSLIKHWEREAAFNGAGHYLHTIFWENMNPKGGGKATGAIAREINRTFGGFLPFKQHFSSAAEKVEGGGWALLVWAPRAHRVEILQAEKHQNLSQQDMIPLLVLDVWEHAYYLKYHNDRKKYIEAWWNVVNWDHVNHRFLHALKVRWKPF